MCRFGQTGHIGIVAEKSGCSEHIPDPRRQRKPIPAVDLVRFDDAMCCVVYGATKADAHALERWRASRGPAEKFLVSVTNLPADAVRSMGRVDRAAPEAV